MEQCVKILKKFEEITSSGLSCLSKVIQHVAELKKYLDKNETIQRTQYSAHMRASFKSQPKKRSNSLGQYPNYWIATFLGSRLKTNYLEAVKAKKPDKKSYWNI